jgi:hypothetical protein
MAPFVVQDTEFPRWCSYIYFLHRFHFCKILLRKLRFSILPYLIMAPIAVAVWRAVMLGLLGTPCSPAMLAHA